MLSSHWNRVKSAKPSIGDVFGGLTVTKVGLHRTTPGVQRKAAVGVRCTCGYSYIIDQHWVKTNKPAGCGYCMQAKQESRPSIGTIFGDRVVVDNTLWTKAVKRKTACLVKCKCGRKDVVAVALLRSGKRSCKDCGTARSAKFLTSRSESIRQEQLAVGKKLLAKYNKKQSKGAKLQARQQLIVWAFWASTLQGNRNTHPEWGGARHHTLVEMTQSELDLLAPSDLRRKGVWPWK